MDMNRWMNAFAAAVREEFGARVRCVGLQGSQARGEASADSDIDVVVILDEWRADDWQRYEGVLDRQPMREKICGFVSGWQELLCWEPSELFGFYYDTLVWYGSLEALRTRFTITDARRAAVAGACAVYHACAHNRLHEKDAGVLRALYKSAFFTLRTVHFCRTGQFVRQKKALAPLLQEKERRLLSAAESEDSFDTQSEKLLQWAGGLLRALAAGEV